MSRSLTELPGRYHQAFNDRDFDVWREVFHEDVELVIDGTVFRGVDAAVGYGVGSVTQFPGLYIESERIIAASGDTVVTEVGLVNGDPGSGSSRRQGAVCEICRVREGRIVSCRSYYMAEAPEPEAVRVPIRGEAARIAEEQAALRRVATLIARGVSHDELFAAVSQEIGWLVGADATSLMRFEPDDTVTLVAGWSASGGELPIGSSHAMDDALQAIRDTAQGWRWGPAELPPAGPFVDDARRLGIRAAVGVPIVVESRVWGVAFASSTSDRPLAEDAEARMAAFAELVATAIANAQARAELRVLLDEQAALRRVATLVAQERPAEVVFAAVAEEVGRLLAVEDTRIVRYEPDGTGTVMASWGRMAGEIPVGSRWRIGDDDAYVGTPITVRGRSWGLLLAGSMTGGRLPAGAEERIGEFTTLVGTAISNTQARADLAASRARIVAAADEERRRVVRDLHDGAQQRLVHTIVTLKLADRALEAADPARAREGIAEALEHAQQATHELRELSHGIMPAVLTQGGLRKAVEALASRFPVPVRIDIPVGRMPARIEATAYFVVAEALTNVSKHAHATGAAVSAQISDHALHVAVRDDGIGGAQATGTGLLGLRDRLAVLDGSLRIESPTDGGTLVAADIPLP